MTTRLSGLSMRQYDLVKDTRVLTYLPSWALACHTDKVMDCL